ncbi:uncharacterized protein LOC110454007 isoform X2 [Mizuhopecten yessoensis]|uniref:uncharacterized protein LOC110454007 isoform X2 n=1 Tax=Mizuhopecten yessoensis TaxID=6573 RepID=UPI000B45F2CA|nr:uncharacterized protein LOC110454007 isoform X2 [Mizuhopecten yessoensis]
MALKGQGSPGQTDTFDGIRNGNEPSGQGPTILSDNNELSYIVYEHDPDLIVEIDIPLDDNEPVINGHSRGPTGTNIHVSGGHSTRKTSSKAKSNSPVKTRGRPIQSHEMEPFLSVDNLPPEKRASQTVNSGSSKSRRKIKSSPGPGNRSSLSGHSPYGSPAFFLRNGRLTPASSVFVTREDSPKKLNHCIKNPFKHSVNYTTDDLNIERGKTAEHCKSPSGEMAQRTAFATFHMGKVLAKNNTESPPNKQGKLLKGNPPRPRSEPSRRLQPLKPVAIGSGPTIRQCRGIVAETKSYGAPPNRTLARRREIVQQIPNIHEYLYERPHTVESIHRTSEASSVDENRDNNVKVDFSDLDLAERLDRATPTPTDRNVPLGPPVSAASQERQKRGDESQDPRVFATEISTSRTVPETTDISEITAEELHNKLNLQNTSSNAKTENVQWRDTDTDIGVISEESPVLSRPQTAGSGQGQSPTADNNVQTQSRPHTAGSDQLQSRPQTASKSVRFAEDPTKEKKGQKSGKDTCKPSDLSNGDNRDDDSDDQGRPSSRDKGQRSGQGEIRLISAGNAGRSSAESDKRTSSSKSDNQGKQQSLKCLQSDRLENKEKTTVKQTVCLRYERSKDFKKPSTLQIQAVGHGGQVHTLICPESPTSRSRSPSPQRRGHRSPSPQNRGHRSPSPQHIGPGLPTNQKNTKQSKHNKSNRLIRPSSANMSARQQTTFRAQKSSNTKVCFEEDRPQHKSIFVENEDGDELYVGIREDQALTFEDIEAELRALQEDIQDRRVAEEHRDVLQDDSSDDSTVVEDRIDESDHYLLGLSQSEEDLLADVRSEDPVDDIQQDCWGDLSGLLAIYRRKCMEVSENCGEISGKLTTPRKPKVKRRPYSAGSTSLYRKDSCQSVYTVDSGKGESSGVVTTDGSVVGLSHATSNLTLDSGLSLADSDARSRVNDQSKLDSITLVQDSRETDGEAVSRGGDSCVTGGTVPPLELHTKQQVEPLELPTKQQVEPLELPTKQQVEPLELHTNQQVEPLELHTNQQVEPLELHTKQQVEPLELLTKQQVEPLELHTKQAPQVEPLEAELVVEDVDEDRTIVDTKALLEIVCEELTTHQKKLQDAEMPLIPKVEPVPPKEDLEIVAEVKTLNKQKKKKAPRSGPIAPFAPVCFEINARPPKGYLYYFAYGTEMSISRLTTYIKREPQRYWGLLFGFQLVFNKKGADLEAGGFANIEFNPYSSVEGCVYPITQQELLLLDKHVGYPEHYEHLVTPLWLMNSLDDPNDYGVAQYCVPALTFIAQDRWIETEEKLDCSGSLSQCIKSSDMVTPGYHDHMVNVGAINSGREQIAAA